MTDHPLLWLSATLVFIAIEGLFAMAEMSAVSFDRVRLSYLVEKGSKRAQMLSQLLDTPARMFGTVLIGVNSALMIGSQCSRNLYESLGLPPELALITQVAFVVVFAELVPLFAARRHYQQVALFCAPIILFFSKIFAPVLYIFNLISSGLSLLFHKKGDMQGQFLSREELQTIVQQHHRKLPFVDQQERIDTLIGNIFQLGRKKVQDIMEPLEVSDIVYTDEKVGVVRARLEKAYVPYFAVYKQGEKRPVGIAIAHDLICVGKDQRVGEVVRPAWFIAAADTVFATLKALQSRRQSMALVLDESGGAVGLVSLEEILEHLLPRPTDIIPTRSVDPGRLAIERTLSCEMTVGEFNARFSTAIEADADETLSQWMTMRLGAVPSEGDKIHIDRFELVVKEASLFGAKTVILRSLRH